MGLAEEALLLKLAETIGELGIERVAPQIDSKTLRESLALIIEKTGEQGIQARLFIPHYWAVYYHDGRSGFGPRNASFLVFYADPSDDPRLEGGYPRRANDIRALSEQEFKDGMAENKERFLRGDLPFMFVVRSVGPAQSHPFFEDGMVGFGASVDNDAFRLVDDYVQRLIDQHGRDSGTATFFL